MTVVGLGGPGHRSPRYSLLATRYSLPTYPRPPAFVPHCVHPFAARGTDEVPASGVSVGGSCAGPPSGASPLWDGAVEVVPRMAVRWATGGLSAQRLATGA